jgi:hypothetical protein
MDIKPLNFTLDDFEKARHPAPSFGVEKRNELYIVKILVEPGNFSFRGFGKIIERTKQSTVIYILFSLFFLFLKVTSIPFHGYL